MNNRNDEAEAKTIIETLYPNPDIDIRKIAVSIVAEGIREANTYGRDKWAVRVGDNNDKIRLTIGHYYTCTLVKSGVWLALDDSFLGNGVKYLPTQRELRDWGWTPDDKRDPRAYLTYKDRSREKDFSRNGYYRFGPKHEDAWPHIRRLFFNFIYKVIYHGQPMDPRTRKLHSAGVLKYIRNEYGVALPDPLY